ncbi:MAG: hypothetical protein RI894_1756 [Bacteroidota bacterium]
MNPNIPRFPIYLLIAAVVILLSTILLNRWTHRNINLTYYAPQLNSGLRSIEAQTDSAMADKTLLRKFLLNNYTADDAKEWENKPFSLFLYHNDSLVFWTNNKVLPNSSETALPKERSYSLFQLSNGKYEQIRDKIRIDTTNYTVITLIPIAYEYAYENEYLHNHIALPGDYPSNLQFAITATAEEASLKTKDGKSRLSLIESGRKTPPSRRNLVLFGYFLSFLLLGISLNGFALFISKEFGEWFGVIALGIMVLIVRNWSNFWNISSEFKDIALFNPEKFTYSLLTTSLGDLLINVSLLTWLVFFFYRSVDSLPIKKLSEIGKLVLVSMFYFFILSGIYTVDNLFNAVVLRSNITLDINDVFTLDQYSFWSLTAIITLMASLFAFSHKLTIFIKKLDIPIQTRMTFLGLSTIVFTILNFANAFSTKTLIILVFGIVFIVLLDIFVKREQVTSAWIAVWVVIFSAFSAYQIYDYNNIKDLMLRRKLGTQLVQDRDLQAEKRIIDLQKIVLADTNLYKKVANPNISHEQIEVYVEREYLTDNYLSQKYLLETHVYDATGDTIKGEKSLMTGAINSRIYSKESVPIGTHNFFWHPNTSISSYISKYPVYKGNSRLISGYLVLELSPRNDRSSAVFSELLTSTAVKEASIDENYDYAIYNDGDLKLQKGKNYEEKLNIDKFPTVNGELFQRDGDRSTLIMQKTKELVVLVSKNNDTLIRPFSLFSYLFFLISFMLGFVAFIFYLLRAIRDGNWLTLTGMPLRTKIQYFVIGTIMASFVVVAAISILYIRSNYADYLGERLITKTKESVAHDFEMTTDSLVLPDVAHLSTEHNTDFDIFDLHGKLLVTSIRTFYDRGISAPQMPYDVIQKLKNHREVVIENSYGGFRVKTAYVPIKKHDGGRNLAFVGIPYTPGTDKALRRDIAGFVQTLLNTYVLLLLGAGVLTILIANSVTQPLQAIGERLQGVKLGAKNEPIKWGSDDEIGVLVAEYNKMILELEQSTTILAQSEREGAWKEMARQVAHEIKNPLTPMKLNIQLLERAFNVDPEKGKAMFKRVSQILIQQIDNLSNIATEFSNFSKMPRANNETFMVNGVVENCFKLFCESENQNIEWSMATAPEEFFVNTDKNQLIQVLNNLLKNAEQAMPDYRRGEINLILYQREKYVVIQVSDNGCGIPQSKRDKIFTPNFTTKGSGSGLGLAISRRIIESAGGTIAFESEEDKGTDFFIELPIVLAFA